MKKINNISLAALVALLGVFVQSYSIAATPIPGCTTALAVASEDVVLLPYAEAEPLEIRNFDPEYLKSEFSRHERKLIRLLQEDGLLQYWASLPTNAVLRLSEGLSVVKLAVVDGAPPSFIFKGKHYVVSGLDVYASELGTKYQNNALAPVEVSEGTVKSGRFIPLLVSTKNAAKSVSGAIKRVGNRLTKGVVIGTLVAGGVVSGAVWGVMAIVEDSREDARLKQEAFERLSDEDKAFEHKVREVISLAAAAQTTDTRLDILQKFSIAFSHRLSADQLDRLGDAASGNSSVKDKMIVNVVAAQVKNYSVEDIERLADRVSSADDKDSMLVIYIEANIETLSAEQVIQLASKSSHSATKDTILKKKNDFDIK